MSSPSSQKYDFVGVSSTQLPYVHDSFPAGPKVGTIRYCTMRSMHRGRDADRKNAVSLHRSQSLRLDNKEIADLKLPKLDFDMYNSGHTSIDNEYHNSFRRKTVDISSTFGNIYRQKAYFRLKGIPMNQVYSIHRTKSDRMDKPHINQAGSIGDHRKTQPTPRRYPQIPRQMSDVHISNGSVVETDISTETDDSDSIVKKSRLQEMDRESPVPGVRAFRKGRHGRKLGNIVSSRRLQQLLDNTDPIDPGAFYYY